MKTYNIVNGTAYHAETKQIIIDVLERARQNRIRLKIYYGDTVTGRSWLEEYDIYGTIGRSTGDYKIPLLIHNSRSIGGGALLDHCIVKICTAAGGQTLYKHPTFFTPDFKIIPNGTINNSYSLLANGETHATGNLKQMSNLCKKLQ